MTISMEAAWAYAEKMVPIWCAEQGITVEITDPSRIAAGAAILRVGKRNYEQALREKKAALALSHADPGDHSGQTKPS